MGSQTIQINTDTLKNIASEFDTIKNELNDFSFTAPKKVGSGLSVKELDAMKAEYVAIKNAVISLLDNTKTFMVQAASDTSKADASIAKKISGEK